MKHASCEDERERLFGEFEARHDRCRGGHQLICSAIQDSCGDGIAFVSRVLHVSGRRGDRPGTQFFVIHLVNQLGRALDAEMREQSRRQARCAASAVGVPNDRAQRKRPIQ